LQKHDQRLPSQWYWLVAFKDLCSLIEKTTLREIDLFGSVLIDTIASEKNITYPTDAKLAIKIINLLNKLAKRHGIKAQNLY
jgi:IS5 family transposase